MNYLNPINCSKQCQMVLSLGREAQLNLMINTGMP